MKSELAGRDQASGRSEAANDEQERGAVTSLILGWLACAKMAFPKPKWWPCCCELSSVDNADATGGRLLDELESRPRSTLLGGSLTSGAILAGDSFPTRADN